MKNKNIIYLLFVLCLIIACNPQSNTAKENKKGNEKTVDQIVKEIQEEARENQLQKYGMDLNEQIKNIVANIEQRYKNGEINRKQADDLIERANRRLKENLNIPTDVLESSIPLWMMDLGYSEPLGLKFLEDESFNTSESDIKAGYNSALLIYQGSYNIAMKEAERIAKDVKLPLSESYQNAKELEKKLGEEIKGIKGINYMNYRFGEEFTARYKSSISVDETGRLKIRVVDVIKKNQNNKYPPLKSN